MERALGTGRTFPATSVQLAAAVNGSSRTVPTAPMATSPSIPRPSLSFLLLLLLLSSAPNGLEGTGGFRLCGLKLTMMLNAICKQQLCGGFVLKKKRSSLHSLPLNMANFASLSTDGGQLEGEQSKALLRHNLLSMDDEVWVNNPTPLEELSWAKRSSYPYKAFGTSKKSGIATECCSKRCTLRYMKTYCCTTSMGGIDRDNGEGGIGTDGTEGQ
uniref:Insulin-like domain-containing protein n=1 Tax=Globodera rostochiensis TaxID=31243 RepID=A0A914HGE3_GLORO